MIPKTSSSFQRQSPETLSTSSQATQFKNATKNLINAVAFANTNEMAMLIDRAISNGAKINYYDSYENHLLVIAVRNRQTHAIPILLARGIEIPNIPKNGIDMLMIAAAAGSEELIDPLIKLADVDIYSCDADGKTALHHASVGGSTKIVGMLLEYGAKPNVYTTKMDDSELCSIFGDNHQLTGAMITPLMIAAATGKKEIVSLLLAGGANPTHGECLPLTLACRKGDVATIKLLLAHQAQFKFSNNDEYAILAIALENGASLECLRLITPHHCFDLDDGTTHSPLGLAIKSKQASSVALLLANGSPIEKYNATENTLWDDAFIYEKKPWELLDLLVTTCPLCNFSSTDYSKENFLINFFENCENPIPLATQGFYPSVVESSRDELQRLHANELSLANMEKQLLTAFVLSNHLNKLSNNTILVTENFEHTEPDRQWIKLTLEKQHEQKAELLKETVRFTNEKFTQLRHSLTLKFFIECNNLCPIKHSLKNFMVNKLITDIGIPFHISESIATIWSQAAQWCVEWHVAPYSLSEANRFLTHLAKNLFHKKFTSSDTNEVTEASLDSHCIALIVDELGNTANPLSTFCKNPVAWLRKLENRSNLRAVLVDELANSLQIELGLHISTCQAISTAWSTTINLARQSRQWQNSAELDKLLVIALAPQMKNCMQEEFAQRIVPEQDQEKLSYWIASVKNQADQVNSAKSGLKRPPTGDPEGAPPAKEARI
jgi:ankyrin repeat protein